LNDPNVVPLPGLLDAAGSETAACAFEISGLEPKRRSVSLHAIGTDGVGMTFVWSPIDLYNNR